MSSSPPLKSYALPALAACRQGGCLLVHPDGAIATALLVLVRWGHIHCRRPRTTFRFYDVAHPTEHFRLIRKAFHTYGPCLHIKLTFFDVVNINCLFDGDFDTTAGSRHLSCLALRARQRGSREHKHLVVAKLAERNNHFFERRGFHGLCFRQPSAMLRGQVSVDVLWEQRLIFLLVDTRHSLPYCLWSCHS